MTITEMLDKVQYATDDKGNQVVLVDRESWQQFEIVLRSVVNIGNVTGIGGNVITPSSGQAPIDRFPQSEEERKALVHSLFGKYAHLPTSSEDFARRKQEEIELEDRPR